MKKDIKIPTNIIKVFKFKIDFNTKLSFKFNEEKTLVVISYNNEILCQYKTTDIETLILEFFIKLSRVNHKGSLTRIKDNIFYTNNYEYTMEDILIILNLEVYITNKIKYVRNKLGITFKELATILNLPIGTLISCASKSNTSRYMNKVLDLLLENIELKKRIEELEGKTK